MANDFKSLNKSRIRLKKTLCSSVNLAWDGTYEQKCPPPLNFITTIADLILITPFHMLRNAFGSSYAIPLFSTLRYVEIARTLPYASLRTLPKYLNYVIKQF